MVKIKNALILLVLFILIFIIIFYFNHKELYFWKFDTEGKTIYLLGTVHAFNPELLSEIDSKILNALDKSDLVLVEHLYAGDLFYNQGDSLKNHICEEDYLEIKKVLDEHGIDISEYDFYRPVYFFQKLLNISAVRHDYDEYIQSGLDLYFFEIAYNNGIKYAALEIDKYNNDFIENKLNKEEMGYYLVKMIKKYFENGDKIKELIDMIIECWLEGTIEAILEDMDFFPIETSLEKYREIEKNIKNKLQSCRQERNFNMVNRLIEEYIDNNEYKSIFVMIGTAHFFGENNIIDILSQKRYKVKRIKKSLAPSF